MKLKNLFLGSFALTAMLFAQSCDDKNDGPTGAPSIELSTQTLDFEKDGGSQTIKLTATRDWNVTNVPDWIAVDPKSGNPAENKEVTITVLENTGMDRSQDIKFTIGFDGKTLTVNQKGSGSASEVVVYHNDFDKELAVKGESGWKTFLDSFGGWKNETGSGISTVEYAFSGMSARTNSTGASNSQYSDYSGSGKNYLWFAKDNYFHVKNITLPEGKTNYTISFGSERNLYQAADNTFVPTEFLVYISNDGSKWVKLEYAFPNGLKNRRWDLASSTFTVPSGTKSLHIYIKATLASAYLMDDLDLSVAASAGTAIDFSKGIDLGTGGSTGGGETPDPGEDYTKAESKTVAEFIAAANKSTYYKLKGTVSKFNPTFCSFDLTDETGTIYVYSVADKSAWSAVKDGGIVEIAGLYDYFATSSKHEVVKAQFLSFTEATAPVEIVNATVAEFIAAEKSVTKKYRVSGTITEIQNPTYGNLKLKDDTGEVLIYGVKKDKDAANTSFSELGAEVGDKLTVVGFRDEYSGTIEMTSGYCEKLEKDTTTPKFSVSTTSLSAKAGDTSASFDVKGNVKWTVSSSNAAYKVSPASGDGAGTVTVKFAANETEKDVTVNLTVSTTEEVATKSYTVVLTHMGKTSATAKFVKVTTAPTDWSGTYLIVNEDVNVALKGSLTADAASNGVSVTISSDEIKATDDLMTEVVTIAAVEGGYSVKTASGKYIYGIASKNKLNYSDTYKEAQLNTITLDSADGVLMTSGTSILRYNSASGQERFRYYKPTSYATQKAVQLYKLVK